jgi:DNA-binding NarL/FixJ family response regulator
MLGREKKIVVGRKEIELAGGITAALGEALSLAALRMTPQATTAYEAVGSTAAEAETAAVVVQVVVRDEEELREAIAAGAEAVLLDGVSAEEAPRLAGIARGLREDCVVEEEKI